MIFLALACRPDPGSPSYPDPSAVLDSGSDSDDPDNYPGPDPYTAGESRLSLGAFYEGGYSELMPVDDVSIFFYVYSSTFSQATESTERIEGYVSDRITVGGVGWWGGGIQSNAAIDLSAWDTLHFSAMSEDVVDFDIRMQSGTEGTVDASSYGFTNDGEWHAMEIPLSDLAGVTLSKVTGQFIFIGEGDPEGSVIFFDNLYYTAD
ncbi:MAG: hypothetical protein ACI8RZ_001869 [Myxococcota bacterium]|jgi:hypothetical protein